MSIMICVPVYYKKNGSGLLFKFRSNRRLTFWIGKADWLTRWTHSSCNCFENFSSETSEP